MPGCIPYPTDFYTEMDRIKSGYYKAVVEHLRSIEDPTEKKLFKAGYLPSITISCTCKNWRRMENMVQHSGLLNIDIDAKGNEHVTDWASVRDDLFNKAPGILAAFLSASGQGVTFVVKIIPQMHLDCFNSIADTLQEYFNLKIDLIAKDPVRLRFVSYDPEAKIRYNFKEIKHSLPTEQYIEKKNKESSRMHSAAPIGDADSLLNFREGLRRIELIGGNEFYEGNKHNYLLKVAGYCNVTGMSQAFCEKMVFKHFRHLTSISDLELLQPIKNAYRTYARQFHTARLGRQPDPMPIKHARFLLKYVKKDIIKKNRHYYGWESIPSRGKYTIMVDSPLLVFLMWLIGPEYTWTCNRQARADKYFSPQDCKDNIPDGAILDHVNGTEVWINKELEYPANW